MLLQPQQQVMLPSSAAQPAAYGGGGVVMLLQPRQGSSWDDSSTTFDAAYDKKSEAARPGYYTVRLPAHGVKVELTATQRVALQRYRFDRSGAVQVLVDLQHGILFQIDARVTQSDVKVDARWRPTVMAARMRWRKATDLLERMWAHDPEARPSAVECAGLVRGLGRAVAAGDEEDAAPRGCYAGFRWSPLKAAPSRQLVS